METHIQTKSSHQIPADKLIGGIISGRKEAAGFKGNIKRESDLVKELLPGPAKIALHEQGIKSGIPITRENLKYIFQK